MPVSFMVGIVRSNVQTASALRFTQCSLILAAALMCTSCSEDERGALSSADIPPSSGTRTGNTELADDLEDQISVSPKMGSTVAGPRGSTSNDPSSSYLSTEFDLVDEGKLSAQKATEVLASSRSLSRAVEAMERDAAKSLEARDLTKHYREGLARAIDGAGVVDNFSCGLSLCVGSVRVGSLADQEAWTTRFEQDPSARSYSYVVTSERIGDSYEQRFMFSTDPGMNGIVDSFEN